MELANGVNTPSAGRTSIAVRLTGGTLAKLHDRFGPGPRSRHCQDVRMSVGFTTYQNGLVHEIDGGQRDDQGAC